MASSPELLVPIKVIKALNSPKDTSIDEEKVPLATDLGLVPSEKDGEVEGISEGDYTPEQCKKVLRKGTCRALSELASAWVWKVC